MLNDRFLGVFRGQAPGITLQLPMDARIDAPSVSSPTTDASSGLRMITAPSAVQTDPSDEPCRPSCIMARSVNSGRCAQASQTPKN